MDGLFQHEKKMCIFGSLCSRCVHTQLKFIHYTKAANALLFKVKRRALARLSYVCFSVPPCEKLMTSFIFFCCFCYCCSFHSVFSCRVLYAFMYSTQHSVYQVCVVYYYILLIVSLWIQHSLRMTLYINLRKKIVIFKRQSNRERRLIKFSNILFDRKKDQKNQKNKI